MRRGNRDLTTPATRRRRGAADKPAPGGWEEICRRCGQCCFEKWVTDDGLIHWTKIPCRHLDIVTRECRVYAKRLEVGEGCVKLTPEMVQTVRWLPEDCAYVRSLRRRK